MSTINASPDCRLLPFLLLLLLNPLLAVGDQSSWTLESNVEEVVPGNTEGIELVCRRSDNTTTLRLKTITRIHITRRDSFGSQSILAEVRSSTGAVSQTSNDVIVSGILKQGDTFLKVKWPKATKDTPGSYVCKVSGVDTVDEIVSIDTNTKIIKEKELSINDIKSIFLAAFQDYKNSQEAALKSEVANLTAFISDELKSIRQQLMEENQKLANNVSDMIKAVKSSCASKDYISMHISDLKNYTVNVITTDATQTEMKYDHILNAIQKTTKSCESRNNSSYNCTNYGNDKTPKNESLDAVCDEKTIQKIKSNLDSLEAKVNSLDTKYDSLVDKVEAGLSGNRTIKPDTNSPTPPATTARPPVTTIRPPNVQTDFSQWPMGGYKLVSTTTSNCPKLFHRNSPPFTAVKDYPIYNKTSDPLLSRFMKSFNVFVHPAGSTRSKLAFCSHDQQHQPVSAPTHWPRGTYCVVKATLGSCPDAFVPGRVVFDIQPNRTDLGFSAFYTLYFCCRSDGSAETPVKLPTDVPFYLFRLNGTCQKVDKMAIRQDSFEVVGSNGTSVDPPYDYSTGSSIDKDVSGKGVALCHYQPSTPS